MAALVAYDYGSESETEEEENPQSVVVIPEKKEATQVKAKDEATIPSNSNGNDVPTVPNILLQLPETQSQITSEKNVVDDKLEDFVPKYEPPKKERKKVKISIPSLSDFSDVDDVNEPLKKKAKSSIKGSTLLSMLPPVRGSPLSTKSFVPHVLKNKPVATGKPKSENTLVPHAVRKNAEKVKMATITKLMKQSTSGSDLESDDDLEMPESFDDDMWQKVCGRKIKPKQIVPVEEPVDLRTIEIAPEPIKPYDGLDNIAFKELVGKSKRPVNIKLIDINEEEIVSDKNMWLTKSITDPDEVPEPVVEDPVDPTRKKKHHITYLAEQAKANEQKLAAQWASNKHSRNQTRAKYGF